MKFDILTLFPEMFKSIDYSVLKNAREKELIEINLINIRDFSKNSYNQVDDTPYGGGAGMIMMPDIIYDAYNSIKDNKSAKVIYMTPKGKRLNQKIVERLSKEQHLIILCGHYEGIDQRIVDKIVDEEISIGDYVLTGGEIPCMVLLDSVSRYVQGVISADSVKEESFSNNLLEYPQYTKPYEFCGEKVPDILLSGNHQKIDLWRKQESLILTYKKRPDLLDENQKREIENLLKK